MRRQSLIIAGVAFLAFAISVFPGQVLAQQKQYVSYKTTGENSKYTQQHAIDVGDVPGHQVRIFEIVRTFPNNPPMINGIALKDQWTRATSDYIDGNGSGNVYGVYTLENGDRFFIHGTLVAYRTGGGKLTATATAHVTGGTGGLSRILGVAYAIAQFDPTTGFNEEQTEIEYTIGK
jgi:hypothetical protein